MHWQKYKMMQFDGHVHLRADLTDNLFSKNIHWRLESKNQSNTGIGHLQFEMDLDQHNTTGAVRQQWILK